MVKGAEKPEIKMPSGYELVDIDELVPYARNPKEHSDKDVNLIVESIKRNGWGDAMTVCPETMEVLSGNGRLLAGRKLGLKKLPVVYAPKGLTERQKADLVISANKLVEVSGYNENLGELMTEFGFGFEEFGMEAEEIKAEEEKDTIYETKIKTPVYEITGEEPKLEELVNTEKADKLIAEINNSPMPEAIKKFLKLTATRLYEFNYAKIAEYYAHQDTPLQDLMEKQALVIIDYEKAVENGFVELSKTIDMLVDMGKDDDE